MEITFDSEFDTTYIIVISEVGRCGGITKSINNGLPSIDCGPGGAICPPFVVDSFCVEYDGDEPYTNVQNPDCQEGCSASIFAAAQIWNNEAYVLDVQDGVEYTFDFCDGYDANVWEALIVVAEYDDVTNQAVPESVITNVFDCSVTFVAPDDMTLIIVVSEVGDCDGDTDFGSDNGTIELICNSNLDPCPEDSICLEFAVNVDGPYFNIATPPCGDDCGDTVFAQAQVWGGEGYVIDATAGSEYIG